MAGAKLVPTGSKGIFKRGKRYVVVYYVKVVSYVDGEHKTVHAQRKETARTLKEARALKAARTTDIARGEFTEQSRVTLHEYAREWIERYMGTGRRGFRDETRSEYRALLDKYALAYFPESARLTELDPRQIADFIGWLVKQPNRSGGTLADSSVRNAFKPLSACLATARREGLIRHNPAAEATLPHRPGIADEEEDRRPLTPAQLEAFMAIVPPQHRLMFDFAARTGLRASEMIGLDGRHLALNGSKPHVKVRQRYRNGKLGPIKTRHARRDVPLDHDLVRQLRTLDRAPDEPVFQSKAGTRIDRDNVRNRVIRPCAEEAGAPWAGWHTLRHTAASMLFARGRNVVQVQRWLGHHAPSFTLDTYVHLLEDDLGEPLRPIGGNKGATSAAILAVSSDPNEKLDSAADSQISRL